MARLKSAQASGVAPGATGPDRFRRLIGLPTADRDAAAAEVLQAARDFALRCDVATTAAKGKQVVTPDVFVSNYPPYAAAHTSGGRGKRSLRDDNCAGVGDSEKEDDDDDSDIRALRQRRRSFFDRHTFDANESGIDFNPPTPPTPELDLRPLHFMKRSSDETPQG